LFVGERPWSADGYLGWWYAGAGDDGEGTSDLFMGVRETRSSQPRFRGCPPGIETYRPDRLDDPCAWRHFWGLHPNGGHFLMVDGSVRPIAYSASGVLPALATRAGGEIASE